MTVFLVSLASFVLGLIALHRMFVWRRSARSADLPLAFAYFLPQHLAFGLGGFLIAIFGQDLYYLTLHGRFRYVDGLVRLQLVHVLSLFAALAGARAAMPLWKFVVRQRGTGPVSGQSQPLSEAVAGQNRTLRKICYASLALHAVLISSQWYWAYAPVYWSLRYFVDAVASQVAPATFFFWGVWWREARRERWIFAAYFAIFGILTLAGQGRGPAVFGVLLFFLGYLLTSGRSLLRLRPLILTAAFGAVFVWLFVMSGELVRISGDVSRRPATVDEWIEQVGGLFRGVELGGDETGLIGAVVLVATRICEISTLDLVARTPEWVPHAGWSANRWLVLATGLLPQFLFPSVPSIENDGPIVLRDYGFPMPVENPSGMSVSVLADSWRRFGWFGVAVFHFFWGAFLSGVSILIGWRPLSMRRFLFAGAVVAIVSTLYTTGLLALITSLPRRSLLALAYAVIVAAICFLKPKSYSHAAMIGVGIERQHVQARGRASQ